MSKSYGWLVIFCLLGLCAYAITYIVLFYSEQNKCKDIRNQAISAYIVSGPYTQDQADKLVHHC